MNELLDKLSRAVARVPDVEADMSIPAQLKLLKLHGHLNNVNTQAALADKSPDFVLTFVSAEIKDLVVELTPKPLPAVSAQVLRLTAAVNSLPHRPIVKITPELRSNIQQLVSTHSLEVATLKARVVNAEAASSKLVHILSNI